MKNGFLLFPLVFALILIFGFSACTGNSEGNNNEEVPADTLSIANVDTAHSEPEVQPVELVSLGLPSTQKQASGKLYPVDEGQLSPDFARFRSELLAAVERKDADLLTQLVDEQIKIGFGAENGRDWFVKTWNLDQNPQDSELWLILKKVLMLGGTFTRNDPNGFIAPYPASTWPDGFDVFEYEAVTGENVRVREKPSLEAKIIGSLSYDIVKLGPYSEETNVVDGERWRWVAIVMPDKTKGYVYGKYLQGPAGYRAYFKRKAGRWTIVSFLAGD